jgi:flagellar biosynthesis/type III secretory pathway M-ring protein FliF/YscJ
MTLSITSVLFVLLGFVVAFTLGRVLKHYFKKRQRLKDEQAAARNESRQVRRARARGRSGR